jgi:hypothetical protein
MLPAMCQTNFYAILCSPTMTKDYSMKLIKIKNSRLVLQVDRDPRHLTPLISRGRVCSNFYLCGPVEIDNQYFHLLQTLLYSITSYIHHVSRRIAKELLKRQINKIYSITHVRIGFLFLSLQHTKSFTSAEQAVYSICHILYRFLSV